MLTLSELKGNKHKVAARRSQRRQHLARGCCHSPGSLSSSHCDITQGSFPGLHVAASGKWRKQRIKHRQFIDRQITFVKFFTQCQTFRTELNQSSAERKGTMTDFSYLVLWSRHRGWMPGLTGGGDWFGLFFFRQQARLPLTFLHQITSN